MKHYLASLLLCAAVHSAEFPVRGQTPSQPKLSVAHQKQLDEKLMSMFIGRRGQCDFAQVQSLIQQGASPNARNWDGNTLTALMVAARQRCPDIVKLLLEAGANVNARLVSSLASGAVQAALPHFRRRLRPKMCQL